MNWLLQIAAWFIIGKALESVGSGLLALLRRKAQTIDDPKKALILAAVWGVLDVHGWNTVLLCGRLAWSELKQKFFGKD